MSNSITKIMTFKLPRNLAKEAEEFMLCLDQINSQGAEDVSWIITGSRNKLEWYKNQKVIAELRSMYPNKPLWKAFDMLKGKYFWLGAITSIATCFATYFIIKKRNVKKFEERMQRICSEYKDDPEAKHLEADGLMEYTLKKLGYSKGVKQFENEVKWYS